MGILQTEHNVFKIMKGLIPHSDLVKVISL